MSTITADDILKGTQEVLLKYGSYIPPKIMQNAQNELFEARKEHATKMADTLDLIKKQRKFDFEFNQYNYGFSASYDCTVCVYDKAFFYASAIMASFVTFIGVTIAAGAYYGAQYILSGANKYLL